MLSPPYVMDRSVAQTASLMSSGSLVGRTPHTTDTMADIDELAKRIEELEQGSRAEDDYDEDTTAMEEYGRVAGGRCHLASLTLPPACRELAKVSQDLVAQANANLKVTCPAGGVDVTRSPAAMHRRGPMCV